MADLTRDKRHRTLNEELTRKYLRPIQASTEVFGGASITRDSSGNVGVRTALERFVGFCEQGQDNSDGSAQATGKDVLLDDLCDIELAISAAVVGDEGKAVFCSTTDQTYSYVPTAGQYVGFVVAVFASGTAIVRVTNPGACDWTTWVTLADDATLALPAQQGSLEIVGGGEIMRCHIGAAGAVTGAQQMRTANTVTLVDPAAASTTGMATQYDLTGGDGSLAVVVDPDVPRNIVVTFTDGDTGISAFTLTATGFDQNGDAATDVFVFADGLVQQGAVAFSTITSIVLTDLAGAGAADTIDIGHGVKYGLPADANATGLDVDHVAVAGTEEAAGAEDATNFTFTPTTAADGAKDITVSYSYVRNFTLGSVNTALTDSDGDLCVYDDGANAVLKNRLAVSATFSVRFLGVNI